MPGQAVPGNVAPNNNLGLQQQPANQMIPQVSSSDPLPINTQQQQMVSKATDVQPLQQQGTMFVNNTISQGIIQFFFVLGILENIVTFFLYIFPVSVFIFCYKNIEIKGQKCSYNVLNNLVLNSKQF